APTGVRELRIAAEGGVTRRPFAVSDFFEYVETEPNDDLRHANEVIVPCVINGHADHPGDIDCYKFLAQGQAHLVFEVVAQRLASGYGSYRRGVDGTGKDLGSNDDGPDGRDSYREVTFPSTTEFYVKVRNLLTDRSGPEYAYRLIIRPPTPDFELQRNLE